MPKKVLFASSMHQFLTAVRSLRDGGDIAPNGPLAWDTFTSSLKFAYKGDGVVTVSWESHRQGERTFTVDRHLFYTRGDQPHEPVVSADAGGQPEEDGIKKANENFFRQIAKQCAEDAGVLCSVSEQATGTGVNSGNDPDSQASDRKRWQTEETFHDAWASSDQNEHIDVRHANEVCTAPEMRHIRSVLGNVRGKRVLDVGCGFGEASVYFAMEGANVTATDISQNMLDAAQMLAKENDVRIRTVKSSAECIELSSDERFDVIYAGNLFHHVDIESTVQRLAKYLDKDGFLISWDPVAYNPLINVYRMIARDVRTPDEHPLRLKDIQVFKKHFSNVQTQWFWFFTLLIFIVMVTCQRRNPNRERLWKAVITEGDKWRWLYQPLEAVDRILLRFVPFLRPLCWNVVIVAQGPVNHGK